VKKHKTNDTMLINWRYEYLLTNCG